MTKCSFGCDSESGACGAPATWRVNPEAWDPQCAMCGAEHGACEHYWKTMATRVCDQHYPGPLKFEDGMSVWVRV